MRSQTVESWVVYETPVKGHPAPARAVCPSSEWAAMAAARPGVYTLIEACLANEGAAERLARGTSGNTPARGDKARSADARRAPKPVAWHMTSEAAPAPAA